VTPLLDGIDLRYVRIGPVELVRRAYAAVRDRNWNTVPGELSDLEIDARDDSFDISLRSRHRGQDIDFAWVGTISGDPSGRIAHSFDGRAEIDMQYNRIGLCVHHPWRETAGAPFGARTRDGEIEGSFPDLIGPQRFEGGVYHALFPAFDPLNVDLGDVLRDNRLAWGRRARRRQLAAGGLSISPRQTFPLYHPLADVAGWRNSAVLACDSEDPLAAVGLCVRTGDGRLRLLVANVTPRALDVAVGPLVGAFRLRRLGEATAAQAGSKPAAFRGSSLRPEASGELALRLEPYEVVGSTRRD